MKIRANRLCLVLCLGLPVAAAVALFTGCAGDRYNRSTGEYIDDKSLRLRVHTALSDNPDYKFEGVAVAVFKGTVQLSGFVDLTAQRTQAGDIVKGVPGVRDVANSITVKDQSERTAGESVDDKTLTASVRTALDNNPDYKYEEVGVTTYRDTVQLSGFVNTADQKAKAGEMAKGVPGVKDVVNNISVKDKM